MPLIKQTLADSFNILLRTPLTLVNTSSRITFEKVFEQGSLILYQENISQKIGQSKLEAAVFEEMKYLTILIVSTSMTDLL